jgi:nucleoside-diphosphate-sugar epimerase
MRICVIGGTGHIGKPLTRMLVERGHEVIVVTSGRTAAPTDPAWAGVRRVQQSYGSPGWTKTVQAQRAEVVIDILQGDAPGLYDAVRGSCGQLLVCGSLWMFGLPRTVPTPEVTQAPCLFDGYAQRYRQMLETRDRALADGIAFSAIMPPNICGPGKIPLDGKGGRDIEVHRAHRRGEPVVLPDPGNVLIGPCDAEDVARGFVCAVEHRAAAAGEIFNVGSAYALTALQFMETYGAIYGTHIPVELVAWQRFETAILPELGDHWHFKANMCPDISKIRSRLGYQPAYTPEQTMERAVRWMTDSGVL